MNFTLLVSVGMVVVCGEAPCSRHYQKWLRLNEARRLMLNEHRDVSSAAFKVGYESPSQFSREYSRLFGVPPKRDMAALRGKAPVTDPRASS
ncbi:AraC-like DNA-binding protein [Pseudomonas sp. JAI120]|nr:AraC-like DNA-binding protein [Pseudomonas sp. SJZ073]MBB6310956.1 AraC-like DNA-binding protein [Pseudomonas sp. JAI120]